MATHKAYECGHPELTLEPQSDEDFQRNVRRGSCERCGTEGVTLVATGIRPEWTKVVRAEARLTGPEEEARLRAVMGPVRRHNRKRKTCPTCKSTHPAAPLTGRWWWGTDGELLDRHGPCPDGWHKETRS